MTNFQNFILESVLFSNSKIEQEALNSFATIEVNGVKQIAKEVVDIPGDQQEIGGYFIDEYSRYRDNPSQYLEDLRSNFYGRTN